MTSEIYAHAGPHERAKDELKRGGSVEKAQVWALLAIAEALDDLAREVGAKAAGTEADPVHAQVRI